MQRPRDFSSYLFSQTNWIMSLVFPVNAVCLSSRCVHPCDPLRLQASSALQKLVYSFFSPTHQLTLHPLHLDLPLRLPPLIKTYTVVAELHIERIRSLTSWSCDSHLHRCSSWADTQASPCEFTSTCNRREEVDNGVTNCVFLFFILLIYSFPYCIATHQHPSLQLSHSSIRFPVSLFPLEREACSGGNEGG